MLNKLKINILGWLRVTPKEVVFEKMDTVVKKAAKKAPAKKAPAKKSSGGGKGSPAL